MCVVYNVIAKCKCLVQLPTLIFTVARLLSTNINDDVAQSRLRLVFAKSHERRPVSLTDWHGPGNGPENVMKGHMHKVQNHETL